MVEREGQESPEILCLSPEIYRGIEMYGIDVPSLNDLMFHLEENIEKYVQKKPVIIYHKPDGIVIHEIQNDICDSRLHKRSKGG